MTKIKCIEVINYLKNFQNDFHEKYFKLLANDYILKIKSFSQNELFQSPNILFYGNDASVLKMYVDSILKTIFNTKLKKQKATYELTNNNNKYNCPYLYSDNHIEIDVNNIPSVERQFMCNFISNQVSFIKNINQLKHIVVIHSVDKLNDNTIFAMRYLIERSSRNALFIFTASSLSKIDDAFLSRCFLVRSNITETGLESFFDYFLDTQKIDLMQVDIDPHKSVFTNILEFTLPNEQNKLSLSIQKFIDEISIEKNIFAVYEKIRNFGYKILHFNVPMALLMKISINHLKEKQIFKNNIHKIITLSAELEHKSLHMSKPILIIEKYFLEIYKLSPLK
jgi:hypothetical protein